MSQFLGCLVKRFYFVWSKIIITSSSCQKCLGEGASIVVPTRRTERMTKVSIGIAIGWRVVDNFNVMASSEYRSIRRAVVHGVSVITCTIWSCLRQFQGRPSWLVSQREKECLGIISKPGATAVTSCLENKKWKGWSMHRLRSKIRIHTDKKIY